MNLKQFNDDDDAVSPVIGVILMVAITVILAAVIATFVLGLGDQVSQTSPQASFSFDYDSSTDQLEITHDGGAAIDTSNLFIRGAGIDKKWDGTTGSDSKVKAGNTMTLGDGDSDENSIADSDKIRVIWQDDNGEETATLSDWSGPDA